MNSSFEHIPQGKKIYVASDFHMGAPNVQDSLIREKKIIRWLNEIESSACGIILAGDIFDFWFEYKTVVPKGSVRLLGKLASISDKGIPVIVFAGNHDLWMKDYLGMEIGAFVFHQPQSFNIGNLKVMIGHGDGLGPGGNKFKFIKKIFTSKINKTLFRWLHPDIGVALGNAWSRRNKQKDLIQPDPFLGEEEALFKYCKSVENKNHHDYYIFGHRHLHLEMEINNTSTYLNLGDWINLNTYAEIEENTIKMKTFEG